MVVFRFNILLKAMGFFSSAPLLPRPGTRICKNRKYTMYRSFPPLICSHQIDLINKTVESVFITERKEKQSLVQIFLNFWAAISVLRKIILFLKL